MDVDTYQAAKAHGARTFGQKVIAQDRVRYVSMHGSDTLFDGRSEGAPFATVAAADAAFAAESPPIVTGHIVLLAGDIPLTSSTLTHTTVITGPSQEHCRLILAAGQTGAALRIAPTINCGIRLSGFKIQCESSSGTIASGLADSTNCGTKWISDVQVSGAPIPYDFVTGSQTVMRECKYYDATTAGVRINGDNGLETFLDSIWGTRLTAGTTSDGILITRTTTTATGGVIIANARITAGAGTMTRGISCTSTAGIPTSQDLEIHDSVVDGATQNSLYLQNQPLVRVSGGWFPTAPGSAGAYAVRIDGGAGITFSGGTVLAGPTDGSGGVFDLSQGATSVVNFSYDNCFLNPGGSTGLAVKVNASLPPTGIMVGKNNRMPNGQLTNRYDILTAAAFVPETTGMRVLLGSTSGSQVFSFCNSDGATVGKSKHFVMNADGDLILRMDNFATSMMRWIEGGGIEANVDFYTNAALSHYGTQLGFFGAGNQTKKTVTGSRGGNAALASLLTQLAGYGLIIDSTTA